MPEIAITLKVVGAGEDYPRLLTGYRRIKGGLQFAVALRPHEGRLLLAVVPKGETGQLYHAVDLDAPTWPTQDTPVKDIASLLSAAQKKLPKTGPIIMRGQWRGKLFADPDTQTLRIELVRKIASYGILTVIGQDGRWTWRFARAEKYFSSPRTTSSPAHQHFERLSEAIKQAYAEALNVVGEACSIKDTRRRQALDPDYAATRPIRPPRERATEPLDRFKLVRAGRGRRKKAPESCDTCASDLPPVSQGRPIPSAPTAAGLKRQATALQKDAEALTSTEVPKVAMSVDAVLEHFINRTSIPGYLDLSERIRDYSKGQLAPLDRALPLNDFIAQLRADTTRARNAEFRRDAPNGVAKTYAEEDNAAITALEHALRSTPTQLARARSLIRYAQAAVSSPKCSGLEEADARQAIARAKVSYEEARKALVKGGEKTALKALRQSAAWVALSASKIAASCKAGQKSLLGRTPKGGGQFAPGEALQAKTAAFTSNPSASTAKAWLKLALSHRGMTATRLSARSTTAGITVTVSGFSSNDIEDTRAIDWLLPNGLTIKWDGLTTKAPAKKPPSGFTPRTFTVPVPQSGNKKAAFSATQEAILSMVTPASARGMLTFEPPKRGSWDLVVTAGSALTANALEKGLSNPQGLAAVLKAEPRKPPAKPRKARSKKKAAPEMSATDAILMQAFQQAIASAVSGASA